MSLPTDLLKQARRLATLERRKPKQASLRRTVSTAYYAVFHLLIQQSARFLVSGRGRGPLRSGLHRAYDHTTMKKAAQAFASGTVGLALHPAIEGYPIPKRLKKIGASFADLQSARHQADYDPFYELTRLDALNYVNQAEELFANWKEVKGTPPADAFLVALLAYGTLRGR